MVYGALAPLYDRIMNHVRYQDWAALVGDIARDYCPVRSPSILEIGGGTGVLGKTLRDAGWIYQGSDLSHSMCCEARKRRLPFFCADARHLPVRRLFDFVLFLYDGINYLTTQADYDRLFAEISRCLATGGLFLFDITTQTNSEKHFADQWEWEDVRDCCYVRHSYYDAAAKVQYNDFVIFTRQGDGSYLRADEHHAQRVLPVPAILQRVPGRTFEVVGVWDEFTRKRVSRDSERVHFLLRKKPQA